MRQLGNEIRHAFLERRAVLFCGAGISVEPPATLPDKLIIDYIDRLRSFAISQGNAARIYLGLRFAVSPNSLRSRIIIKSQ